MAHAALLAGVRAELAGDVGAFGEAPLLHLRQDKQHKTIHVNTWYIHTVCEYRRVNSFGEAPLLRLRKTHTQHHSCE